MFHVCLWEYLHDTSAFLTTWVVYVVWVISLLALSVRRCVCPKIEAYIPYCNPLHTHTYTQHILVFHFALSLSCSLSGSTRPGVAAPAAKENGTIAHTYPSTHKHTHKLPLHLCWLIVKRQTRRFAFMRFINRGQATINSLLNSLTILNSFSPVTATSVAAGSERECMHLCTDDRLWTWIEVQLGCGFKQEPLTWIPTVICVWLQCHRSVCVLHISYVILCH